MAFTRKVEDFDCAVCGARNRGDGYTNHCASCLSSLHVDIDPGDRAEGCGGVMPPLRVEVVRGSYVIVHRCERCGAVRRCKASEHDDAEAIYEAMRRAAERALREGL